MDIETMKKGRDPVVEVLKKIAHEIEELGFGNAARGPNEPGAVEGLTIHLDDRLEALDGNLARIAEAVEDIADLLKELRPAKPS